MFCKRDGELIAFDTLGTEACMFHIFLKEAVLSRNLKRLFPALRFPVTFTIICKPASIFNKLPQRSELPLFLFFEHYSWSHFLLVGMQLARQSAMMGCCMFQLCAPI
jgi:hypothetical protein